MPRRSCASSISAVSWSSIQIRPPVGVIIRLIIRSDVVLPHPDGPTRTVILPVGASNVSSSTSLVPSGNCFETASNRIMRANLTEITHGRLWARCTQRWCQQSPHHELGDNVMPRLGRKQHGVPASDELMLLDLNPFFPELHGKLGSCPRVGGAIGGAVGQQDRPVCLLYTSPSP